VITCGHPTTKKYTTTRQYPEKEMPLGIKKDDWDKVHELACEVVNATLGDDEVLRESRNEELLATLNELRIKYGEHPSILGTLGDFTENTKERMALYSKALGRAKELNYQDEIDEIEDSIHTLENEH
jgi:hypothetical protein